jgi:hypothetical protein
MRGPSRLHSGTHVQPNTSGHDESSNKGTNSRTRTQVSERPQLAAANPISGPIDGPNRTTNTPSAN